MEGSIRTFGKVIDVDGKALARRKAPIIPGVQVGSFCGVGRIAVVIRSMHILRRADAERIPRRVLGELSVLRRRAHLEGEGGRDGHVESRRSGADRSCGRGGGGVVGQAFGGGVVLPFGGHGGPGADLLAVVRIIIGDGNGSAAVERQFFEADEAALVVRSLAGGQAQREGGAGRDGLIRGKHRGDRLGGVQVVVGQRREVGQAVLVRALLQRKVPLAYVSFILLRSRTVQGVGRGRYRVELEVRRHAREGHGEGDVLVGRGVDVGAEDALVDARA